MSDPTTVVERFNDAITERDIRALDALMTEDHLFIDSAGNAVAGKEGCLDLWRDFFDRFSDYVNVFESVTAVGGLVKITGHSVCDDDRLDGPAIWTARVREGQLSEWRVYDDTPEIRESLDIDPAQEDR